MTGHELLHGLLRASREFVKSGYDELARRLGKSRSYVEKIVQEPPSETNPDGIGIPNPIDQVDAIFDFALQYGPEFAGIIAARYTTRLEEHKKRQQLLFVRPTDLEWVEQVQRFFQEKADVLTALTVNANADQLEREWEEAASEFRQLLAMKRARDEPRFFGDQTAQTHTKGVTYVKGQH